MAALSAAPALAARLSAVRGKTVRSSSRDVARRAIQVDSSADAAQAGSADPLMLRAIRGEDVERPPIWMMRQAGRYMKIYQDLCKKHPTFRERSETVDLAVEISLQPWDAFKPDGVILFSDILTPLSGMDIPFDIVKGTGPIIMNPVRSMEDVKAITPLEPEESMPFVGESLGLLRKAVGNDAAAGQIFNAVTNRAVTLNGMVEICAKAAGVTPTIVNYDVNDMPPGVEVKKAFPFRPIHFYSYPAKALEVLDWKPKHDLASDMAERFAFYKASGRADKEMAFENDDKILNHVRR